MADSDSNIRISTIGIPISQAQDNLSTDKSLDAIVAARTAGFEAGIKAAAKLVEDRMREIYRTVEHEGIHYLAPIERRIRELKEY